MLVPKICKVGILWCGHFAEHALFGFRCLFDAHIKFILRGVPYVRSSEQKSLLAGDAWFVHHLALLFHCGRPAVAQGVTLPLA